ncbi:MAG: polysaccharide biosynthesis tyrosine autokinase [Oscillospiraceae bacterium]|nr:polysaccharide biosynthesis tyrosine autokinase [Oscillospiraceae bacterium]
MQEVIDVKKILFFLWRVKKWIIGSALVGFILLNLISTHILPKIYTSSVEIYVNSSEQAADTARITTGEISAAQALVNTYIVILQNNDVIDKVRSRIPNAPTTAELRSYLSMASVNNTQVLRILVRSPDADLSKQICDVLADVAPGEFERVVKAGSIVVLGQPRKASTYSSPDIRRNSLLGLLGGMAVSIAIAVVILLTDNTVKGEEDLKNYVKTPILGEVPSFDEVEGKKRKRRKNKNKKLQFILLNSRVPFKVVEAYKSVRANLMFTLPDSEHKSIVISSAEPSAGKSNTSASLAVTMAQTGLKTIILDADMRKPVQHKIFGVSNNIGLSQVLCKTVELKNAIKHDIDQNLDLITSGLTPPNPSELLGSQNMSDLLECLSEFYDYIFIDTPPINMVSDALMVSGKASGVLLVARQNHSNYRELQKTIETLDKLSLNNLGIVVNDVSGFHKPYKYGYYNSYKAYEYKN